MAILDFLRNKGALSNVQIYEIELKEFKNSIAYKDMIDGVRYYSGDHDILRRVIYGIGAGGVKVEIPNAPNYKVVDNDYKTMVDQKVNYLVSKPVAFESEDAAALEQIKTVTGPKFNKVVKSVIKSAVNNGIAYLMPYVDTEGQLNFKVFEGSEFLPLWEDKEHTSFKVGLRLRKVTEYNGTSKEEIEKVEVYTANGVDFYINRDGTLIRDVEAQPQSYVNINGEPMNWGKIPVVAFKYNDEEQPLLNRVRTIQDSINEMLSDLRNTSGETVRNTILEVKNYSGENPAEFRENLNRFGVVFVEDGLGVSGGVTPIVVDNDKNMIRDIIKDYKKLLISNARGYDAKDDRMSNNPNQMNIQSMYSDIDLDTTGMETLITEALDELMYFICIYLGVQKPADMKYIFNKDGLINESQTITDCKASQGIISDETIISMHPWVTDVKAETERLKKQKIDLSKSEKGEPQGGAYPPNRSNT